MSHAYSDIAFTPAVRRLQERLGSREQYAFLDELPETNRFFSEREAAFIESRDTLFQATVSETGWPYVQHRGGPAGFIKVLNKNTIAFPDFRGNVQYLSVANLSQNNRISIILMDAAKQRRLKLLGHATLVEVDSQPELFEQLKLDGYEARVERAFIVRVAGFDWNCPQHITPRFTEDEIANLTAPLRMQLRRTEERLAELASKAQQRPDQVQEFGHGPLPLVVTAIRQLTPRVRSFELRHADGAELPSFESGAHIAMPVLTIDGSESLRPFSISSSPGQRRLYEIAVQREDDGGGGSRFVHEAWSLGTVLHSAYPVNSFQLDPSAIHSVFIAGGIGITPLRSMALNALMQGQGFELHHVVRSVDQAPYVEQLSSDLGSRYVLHNGRADAQLWFDSLLSKALAPSVHVYVCGPGSMIETLRERAQQIGVLPSQFHSERFFGVATPSANKPIEVHLKKSGRVVHVAQHESILDAFEKAGIVAPSSCRTGICRTCAVRVLSGEPDHRDEVLTQKERNEGALMCLCVSRAKTPIIEIDL